MTGRVKVVLITLVLLAVAGGGRFEPAPPVIILNRTATASFISVPKRSPIFVLVIGSDIRDGDPKRGRADSLHLVAINQDSGRGTVVGIPRDSYVSIPGQGMDKINSSLTGGGPERTVQTVSGMSRIPIHYWALVDFARFRRLVDAVGGVTMNVPYRMLDAFSGVALEAGTQKLDGGQALAFARTRKTIPGGDFERSRNQGRLLVAALAQFRDISTSPVKLAGYLAAFRLHVESNVPTRELLELVTIARGIDPKNVENLVAPGGGGSAGGSSVVFLSAEAGRIWDQIRNDGVR